MSILTFDNLTTFLSVLLGDCSSLNLAFNASRYSSLIFTLLLSLMIYSMGGKSFMLSVGFRGAEALPVLRGVLEVSYLKDWKYSFMPDMSRVIKSCWINFNIDIATLKMYLVPCTNMLSHILIQSPSGKEYRNSD